jgi:hypothetical protein
LSVEENSAAVSVIELRLAPLCAPIDLLENYFIKKQALASNEIVKGQKLSAVGYRFGFVIGVELAHPRLDDLSVVP